MKFCKKDKRKLKNLTDKIITVFFVLILFLSCNGGKRTAPNFSLLYLFQKGYSEDKSFLIYNNNQLISSLDNLKNRNILEIRFDRETSDSILFAERIGNVYRVIRHNYNNGEEKILFGFKHEIYRFSTFTENSFFWREKCNKSNEPHVLYKYDSRTGKIKMLFHAEDILDKWGERYEHRFITGVHADDKIIYFYMDGGFVGDSGSFVIDRLTYEVRKNKIDIGWSYPSRYKNKIIREGSVVTLFKNMKSYRSNGKSCIITDLFTFEEVQCNFKKRYERMAGNLILLSENHFLAPLCISPFKDSIRNGLFGSNWTVCYTVFDIKHNKPVFNGITTETKIMRLVDCVLANDEDIN